MPAGAGDRHLRSIGRDPLDEGAEVAQLERLLQYRARCAAHKRRGLLRYGIAGRHDEPPHELRSVGMEPVVELGSTHARHPEVANQELVVGRWTRYILQLIEGDLAVGGLLDLPPFAGEKPAEGKTNRTLVIDHEGSARDPWRSRPRRRAARVLRPPRNLRGRSRRGTHAASRMRARGSV